MSLETEFGPELRLIHADWPAPAGVFACTTTRHFDKRARPGAGDTQSSTATTPEALRCALELPSAPVFLSQKHGVRVVEASPKTAGEAADGCFSCRPRTVCGVLSADCVPVLFCSVDGERLAAAHAGWRGLADGILEATVAALGVPGRELLVWLGPAIGPDAFEVGDDVLRRFCTVDPATREAFRQIGERKWLADLYRLCRMRLASVGIDSVYGGTLCTYSDRRFYSYRRDGATGRMASLVWRK